MRNFTTQQQSTHPQFPLERRPRPWPGVHMFGESENGASQIGVPLAPHTWVKERRRRGRRSGWGAAGGSGANERRRSTWVGGRQLAREEDQRTLAEPHPRRRGRLDRLLLARRSVGRGLNEARMRGADCTQVASRSRAIVTRLAEAVATLGAGAVGATAVAGVVARSAERAVAYRAAVLSARVRCHVRGARGARAGIVTARGAERCVHSRGLVSLVKAFAP